MAKLQKCSPMGSHILPPVFHIWDQKCVCASQAPLCDVGKDFFLFISVSPHLEPGMSKVFNQWLGMKKSLSIIKNILRFYTGNSELQMQWFPSTSAIYENLKPSIVNYDLVLGMGHCQRNTTQKQPRSNFQTTNSLSPFLKQYYKVRAHQQFIRPP